MHILKSQYSFHGALLLVYDYCSHKLYSFQMYVHIYINTFAVEEGLGIPSLR